MRVKQLLQVWKRHVAGRLIVCSRNSQIQYFSPLACIFLTDAIWLIRVVVLCICVCLSIHSACVVTETPAAVPRTPSGQLVFVLYWTNKYLQAGFVRLAAWMIQSCQDRAFYDRYEWSFVSFGHSYWVIGFVLHVKVWYAFIKLTAFCMKLLEGVWKTVHALLEVCSLVFS